MLFTVKPKETAYQLSSNILKDKYCLYFFECLIFDSQVKLSIKDYLVRFYYL